MGASLSAVREVFPAPPRFTAESVPDLTGKLVLITGGNNGIGKETAKALLQHNAKVYIACRSLDKAKVAAEELRNATGKTDQELVILKLDLADLDSVKAAVDEYLQKENRLDVLINNGGVMAPPIDRLTKLGHDLQFGTNVLGHFYFTQLLLPTLIASAKSSPDGKARIVNVSSTAHLRSTRASAGGPVLLDTLVDGPKRRQLNTGLLYCQSKSGSILFAHALARKYGDQGIVSTALNPGLIKTDLWQYTGFLRKLFLGPFMASTEYGALTQLYAATAPEGVDLNGKYLGPWATVRECRPDHNDVPKEDALWDWCAEQIKKHAP